MQPHRNKFSVYFCNVIAVLLVGLLLKKIYSSFLREQVLQPVAIFLTMKQSLKIKFLVWPRGVTIILKFTTEANLQILMRVHLETWQHKKIFLCLD